MGLRETLNKVHQVLKDADIDHALIGGLGLASLGVHRATNDVDLLVEGEQRTKVQSVLESAGWQMVMGTQEVLHFEGFGNVDILLANRSHSKNMLSKAKVFPQHKIKCVSTEGIIGLKIQAYRNDKDRELQDKADIKSLIEKYPELDWAEVKTYADLFGEWKFIQSLRKSK